MRTLFDTFANLLESKPDETDEEYAESQIDQLVAGANIDYALSELTALSTTYPDVIGQRAIPPVVSILTKTQNPDLIRNIFILLYKLLHPDAGHRAGHALAIIKEPNTLLLLIRHLDSTVRQNRILCMSLLSELAILQPPAFRLSLMENQPQMQRLLAALSDPNEDISTPLARALPFLLQGDHDFQQIVGFCAMESLVSAIRPDRPEFIAAVTALLEGNEANQKIFIDSGFLRALESSLRAQIDGAFDLIERLFESAFDGFDTALSNTAIVDILIVHIFRGSVWDMRNIHLLCRLMKGHSTVSEQLTPKLPGLITLFVNDDSLPLFDLLTAYLFESEANGRNLAAAISGFGTITDILIAVGTFCVLVSPNTKSECQKFFEDVLEWATEGSYSAFRFFISLCWHSRHFCEAFVGSSLFKRLWKPLAEETGEDATRELIYFLFAVILLEGCPIVWQTGGIVTELDRLQVVELINRTEINEGTRFGPVQRAILDAANERLTAPVEAGNRRLESELNAQIAQLRAENARLSAALSESENRPESEVIDFGAIPSNDEFERLKNENETNRKLLEDLQNTSAAELQRKDEELRAALAANEQLKTDLCAEQASGSELRSTLAQSSDELSGLRSMIALREAENGRLNDKIRELESAFDSQARSQSLSLTASPAVEDKRIATYERRIEEKDILLQSLQEQISSLSPGGEFDELKRENTDYRKRIEELQQSSGLEIQRKNEELEAALASKSQLAEENSANLRRIQELEKSSNAELQRKDEELQAALASKSQLEADNAANRRRLEDLQKASALELGPEGEAFRAALASKSQLEEENAANLRRIEELQKSSSAALQRKDDELQAALASKSQLQEQNAANLRRIEELEKSSSLHGDRQSEAVRAAPSSKSQLAEESTANVRRIEELERSWNAELQRKDEELEAALASKSQLEGENKRLSSALSSEKAKTGQLTASLAELSGDSHRDLSGGLPQSKRASDDANLLEERDAEILDLRIRLGESEDRLRAKDEVIGKLQATVGDISLDNASLHQEIDFLQSTTAGLKSELALAKLDLALSPSNEEDDEALQELNHKLLVVQGDRDALEDQLRCAQIEVARRDEQIADLENQVQSLTSRNAELAGQAKALFRKCKQLSASAGQSPAVSQSEKTEESNKSIRALKRDSLRQIAALEERIAALQSENAELLARLSEPSSSSTLDEQRQEIDRLTRENGDLESGLRDVRERNQDLLDENAELVRRIEQVQTVSGEQSIEAGETPPQKGANRSRERGARKSPRGEKHVSSSRDSQSVSVLSSTEEKNALRLIGRMWLDSHCPGT
jgi:hypothetical protein